MAINYPKVRREPSAAVKDQRYLNLLNKIDMQMDYTEINWMLADLENQKNRVKKLTSKRLNK